LVLTVWEAVRSEERGGRGEAGGESFEGSGEATGWRNAR